MYLVRTIKRVSAPMANETRSEDQGATSAWPTVMSWVGRTTALIGLFATLAGGVTWLINHHKRAAERAAKIALAQAQTKQGEYQAAIDTYAAILKTDPLYRSALDQQLDTAMLWVEDYHVLVREGQDAGNLSAPQLDEILSVLDAGLTRSSGTRAADVQAHIGWTHWLNQHIAEREFGHAAEQNLRAALAADPSNVYANAMLGNWILQNRGDFNEAIQHLNSAVSTGKVRPFVRTLQLGGLIHLERPGARSELVRVANEMRRSGEPLDEEHKSRILGFCFDPVVTDHTELQESLSAVSPDDVWSTYLWLDDNPDEARDHALVHQFVQANLMELSGKRLESLDQFRALQRQLKNTSGSMKRSVDTAIARLSHE
jgi:tetratricopeptide (TPR) repeat protein